MHDRQVLVHADRPTLATTVAERFLSTTEKTLQKRSSAHIVLTGGSIGIGVLAAVASSPARDDIDWSKVHFWWGDERWLPRADPERNELQARQALLETIDIPASNIHAFAASDEGVDLDTAARQYADQLLEHATAGESLPHFDLTFLGVGPDGHIASLFPEHNEIQVTDRTVVPVRDSPKPPPERLSLTLRAINSSERVWMVLAGADKASALGLALAGASRNEVPAAGVHGSRRTVFFVDEEAAAEVPAELISPSY